MEQWDGTERRSGDRRKAQRVPYQEYPKHVNGREARNADHEAAILAESEAAKADQPKASRVKAGKKK